MLIVAGLSAQFAAFILFQWGRLTLRRSSTMRQGVPDGSLPGFQFGLVLMGFAAVASLSGLVSLLVAASA